MRSFVAFALLLGCVMHVQADTFVYVSMSPEQKIQVYRLDPANGQLSSVETFPVDGSPGSLRVDPRRKFLFASLRSTSKLASFAIDPDTGRLRPLGFVTLPPGENAAFVGTDRSGQWLLSASYAAGKVVVHRIHADGTIAVPAIQTVVTAKTAHCVATDPDNRFVFVPHVAPNAVYQFPFDAATGELSPATQIPGGAPGAGPRHLTFHPDPRRQLAFTSDESGSSITAYRFDPDTGLKPYQTLSTLPAGYSSTNSTAEVKVHPNGNFVWVSNRGHDSLACFAIAPDGSLSPRGQTPTEKTPRSFDIDPEGRFVFGAGEGSGKLAVFRVRSSDGQLTRIHTYDVGRSLSWVMAVRLGDGG